MDDFAEHRMGFQCVALSYFVALAVVPLLAFVFAISGGLGLSDRISDILHSLVPGSPDFLDSVIDKAGNIIDAAQSGTVGLVSALTFLWTILWLMFQVERVFNNVWGIRRVPRKLYARFSFYFGVLLLLPFVLLIFGSGIAYYTNLTNLIGLDLGEVRILPQLLGWLAFYVVVIFTLSAMYKFIPAVWVSYRCALYSSLLTAAVFTLFQYIYLETQVFVTRLNDVYGVIAAIPLFLIWMNYSWQIIIYGAQLTCSLQKVGGYEPESV
ncbi:MAG: YihY/virulence factor BrkB family protein [Bacteroidales bacterium]|nr:YihY/virulence factor BrkB family protein [Bacteroidales bacterium]